MSRPASSTFNTSSKPALKNPLRASTMSLPAPAEAVSGQPEDATGITEQAVPGLTAQQLRQMQISEFSAWLRTQTNKHKRPFQDETIRGHAETARALDLWMAEEDIDGDFRDLLEVTGGGRATSFADIRDHAMIRMLTEGVRRKELAQQDITDLSEDLITRPFVRVVPLKRR